MFGIFKSYLKAKLISSIFSKVAVKAKSTFIVEFKNFIVNLVLISYTPLVFMASLIFLILTIDRYFKDLPYFLVLVFSFLFLGMGIYLVIRVRSYMTNKLNVINRVKNVSNPLEVFTRHWVDELAKEQRKMVDSKGLQ